MIWDAPYNLSKIFKKSSEFILFFSADYTRNICFSLIPIVDKGKMHYDAYSCFSFSLILRILNAMTANLDS